jgi:hypothetical protein
MNSRITPAVVVPVALMDTSSIRLPDAPAVNTVPTFVGAVREVSAVEITTAEARTVDAKFGVVAMKSPSA